MIFWTEEASRDMTGIARWIAADSPAAAERVTAAIFASVEHLAEYPLLGRPSRVAETRELVVPRFPYVVVYRPVANGVAVIRVLHGAMRWPPEDH